MRSSTVETMSCVAESVRVSRNALSVELSDGRMIAAPLAWFPRLLHATRAERENWRFIARGHGIHWEGIDEDISVANLLAGRASDESQASFKKWLESRAARRLAAGKRRLAAVKSRRRAGASR